MDDKESLAALVALLPAATRAEYESYEGLTLESVFPNRRLMVYTSTTQGPQDVESILVGDPSIDRIAGFSFPIETVRGTQTIGYRPVQLKDREVFFHVPQNFVLKWSGKTGPSDKVQFAPRYAILLKTRSREHKQVEGHTYCVTLNQFRERFPQHPSRY